MERSLSAPGKLFLSGEYSVLWGGTARIAAVGPRAHALVRRRDDKWVRLLIEEGRLQGLATPLGVRWEQTPPAAFRFVARAVDDALRARNREGLGFDLAFAPSPRAPDGRKLGLGSSARATVLATEAARFILEDRSDPLKLALLSHAQAQDGKGSGADVAASFAGGILRYRRFEVARLAALDRPLAVLLQQTPAVDLVKLSTAPMFLAFAFTGTSASTPDLIRSAEQALDAAARASFVQTSDTVGQALEEALVRGRFDLLEDAVKELQSLLAGLKGVATPEAERLLNIAGSHGCVGKVSGAGGGDGCVVFCPSAESRTALLDAYQARQVYALALEIEPGLRGEANGNAKLQQWVG